MKFLKLFLVIISVFLIGCLSPSEILKELSGEKQIVLSENEEVVYEEKGLSGKLVSSPDGKRWAFLESPSFISDKKLRLIIDNVTIGAYDSIENFQFSPDSKKYAFIAENDEKRFVVFDGKTYDHYVKETGGLVFGAYYNPFKFTKDNHLVYITLEEPEKLSEIGGPFKTTSKRGLVIDGNKKGVYDKVFVTENQVALIGKKVAFFAEKNDKRYVVIDGEETEVKNGRDLTMSSDGKIAYVVTKNDNGRRYEYVVVDGKPENIENKYGVIGSIQITPDGKIAYSAERFGDKIVNDFYYIQEWYAVVNGKETKLDMPLEFFSVPDTYGVLSTVSSPLNVELIFDSGGKLRGYATGFYVSTVDVSSYVGDKWEKSKETKLDSTSTMKTVVFDGKTIKAEDIAPSYSFKRIFINNGKFIALLSFDAYSSKQPEDIIFADDKVLYKYREIEEIKVSPKGRIIMKVISGAASTSGIEDLSQQKSLVVIDEQEKAYLDSEEFGITAKDKFIFKASKTLIPPYDNIVIEDQEGREYESVSNYVILPDGKVVHYAILGDKVLRVTRE